MERRLSSMMFCVSLAQKHFTFAMYVTAGHVSLAVYYVHKPGELSVATLRTQPPTYIFA